MATPENQALAAVETFDHASVIAACERRGIDDAQWRTLKNNLFPGAKTESIFMVVDYCRARKLDPLKKPCHIVPMKVKDARTGVEEWRDVVMPGIYEYRTTAMRTGLYLGHSAPVYGPLIDFRNLKPEEIAAGEVPFMVPEFCAMTFSRWNATAGRAVEFPVRVEFREVVALTNSGAPNSRWMKSPVQMMTKCCEAAGLREAFPDEFGGESTFEEMERFAGSSEALPAAAAKPALAAPRDSTEKVAVVKDRLKAAAAASAGPTAGAGAAAPRGEAQGKPDEEISAEELARMREADRRIADEEVPY